MTAVNHSSTENYLGVSITSRYGFHAEMALMKKVLRNLPIHYLKVINSIWCDSKAGHDYAIELDDLPNGDFTFQIADKFVEFAGGYNGIKFDIGKHSLWIAPYWAMDFE